MAKYVNVDFLIWKIKNQIRFENLSFAALGGGGQTFCTNTLEWVLKQIDSLQQEQQEESKNLEEEFNRMWDKELSGECDTEAAFKVARHFAEWQEGE